MIDDNLIYLVKLFTDSQKSRLSVFLSREQIHVQAAKVWFDNGNNLLTNL